MHDAYRGSMTVRDNALGAFLRARRELLNPVDHGLPGGGRRRVLGLRREEVALLAGVSPHYYTRLEQGRDRHPSPPVLDALARVLQLDVHARAHLDRLADSSGSARRRRPQPERIRPELEGLLHLWTDQAAVVLGRYRDVLAANALATALNPSFTPGRNTVRDVFLDPGAQETYVDHEEIAGGGVAALRASVGADVDDPRLNELVGELSVRSEEFRQMWARHDVREKPGGCKRFNNPLVGPLRLRFEAFSVGDADRQFLYVFYAEPGTDDARSLQLLAQLAHGVTPARGPAQPVSEG